MSDYLLLETGDRIDLEDHSGFLILERLSIQIVRLMQATLSAAGAALKFVGIGPGATIVGSGAETKCAGTQSNAAFSGKKPGMSFENLKGDK